MLLITPVPAKGPGEVWFIFNGNKVMHIKGQLPRSVEGLALTQTCFVGNIGDLPCYASELVGNTLNSAQWLSVRQTLLLLAQPYQQALSRAWQLLYFNRSYRYCSCCAGVLASHPHDYGKGCLSCGAVYYPRISPAMMVAVVRGEEILLARAPQFAEGMYSALAGFVEPGETVEECVQREVMEEVGIQLDQLYYVGSQQWPFPHSLMLAFWAEYGSGDIVPQAAEIADARWFHIDDLPLLPSPASIAHWLIQYTIAIIRARQIY